MPSHANDRNLWTPVDGWIKGAAGEQRLDQITLAAEMATVGHSKPCPKLSVIDLGCGTCVVSDRLRAMGDLWGEITVLDKSDERVPAKWEKSFWQMDLLGLKPADFLKYDLVIAAGIWYHMSLSQQTALLDALRMNPVVLDTHFTRVGAVRVNRHGGVYGQYRKGTKSSMHRRPFVHCVESLAKQWQKTHAMFQLHPVVTEDRGVFLMMPKGDTNG